MSRTGNLYSEIHKEIERCRGLLEQYRAIGPVGNFGHAMISTDIRRAEKAMEGEDVQALISALEALRGCK